MPVSFIFLLMFPTWVILSIPSCVLSLAFLDTSVKSCLSAQVCLSVYLCILCYLYQHSLPLLLPCVSLWSHLLVACVPVYPQPQCCKHISIALRCRLLRWVWGLLPGHHLQLNFSTFMRSGEEKARCYIRPCLCPSQGSYVWQSKQPAKSFVQYVHPCCGLYHYPASHCKSFFFSSPQSRFYWWLIKVYNWHCITDKQKYYMERMSAYSIK